MNDVDRLLEDVAEGLRRKRLLVPGQRVVVAVSAGADSTALAALLRASSGLGLALDLVLVHVDHDWRGRREAAADRALLEALAERLGLPLVVSAPPASPVRSEDAARRWRYHVLAAKARRLGAPSVATGHHLLDQAETVWMRLDRGSGRVGLAGIPVRRPLGGAGPPVEVVRPLLDVDPRRLRAWLQARKIPWREDPTNAGLDRDRLRARHRLRLLEARGGAGAPGLAAHARRHARRRARREARLLPLLEGDLHLHPAAAAADVARARLAGLGPADLDLALRHLGRRTGADAQGPWFTRRHVALVRRTLERGGAVDLPRGARLTVGAQRVWLLAGPGAPGRGVLPRLGRQDLPAASVDLESFRRTPPDRVALLDAGVLGPGARLRFARPGDRFVPHGSLSGRAVDLDRWLARQRVPRRVRPFEVVLEGERGIAWVVGRRIDLDHAVGAATRTVARMEARSPGDPA
ncbi:MAG: tRNA lysidine(34) synthetase TilS [Planctomycetota bacterium]